jgi:hypothetical protein
VTINVCVAGATGWTGRPIAEAVLASNDLVLRSAVSRSAAGQDLGTAWGGVPKVGSQELFMEAICDHRLAPSVHDLFVNDLHRRFFQRVHRYIHIEPAPQGGQRNCDNLEIYAGSPSYLISAGGRPAAWVILGGFKPSSPTSLEPVGWQQQNIGVALPISFMPVGHSAATKSR